MKIIAQNVALLSEDVAVRKLIADTFTAVQEHSAAGGMTLDVAGTPVVVCYGKMSLADEKALRHKMRADARFGNAKLSRTNNVAQRCNQYAIADSPQTFKAITAAKEATKEATKDTPAATPAK